MARRPVVLGEAWDEPGAPPWDGTGVPFPTDPDTGWPVIPDGGGPTPGTLVANPNPVDPQTNFDVTPTLTEDPGEAPMLWHDTGVGWVSTGGAFTGGPLVWTVAMFSGAYAADSTNGLRAQLADGTVVGGPIDLVVNANPAVFAAGDEGYEPADHTVAEVQAYLADHPDQTDYVLDRERAGKNRTTLTGG